MATPLHRLALQHALPGGLSERDIVDRLLPAQNDATVLAQIDRISIVDATNALDDEHQDLKEYVPEKVVFEKMYSSPNKTQVISCKRNPPNAPLRVRKFSKLSEAMEA